jgi:DNA-binding CsgD family transcriptional regulator
MTQSRRLRLRDVREVFRLVGECRDLGVDARAWRSHLVVRTNELLHARVGFTGEMGPPVGAELAFTQLVDHGWESERGRSHWLAYMWEGRYRHDPAMSRAYLVIERRQTMRRRQCVSDRDWYRSIFFSECLETNGIDDSITSTCGLPGRPSCSGLTLFRARRDRHFTARECQFVRLLHAELCREAGRSLATASDPSASDLSPRLHQTLRALLEGDGEKQLAARLGLSRDTIHEYVRRIYQHFGVSTRAELLAYFLRRSGLQLPEL